MSSLLTGLKAYYNFEGNGNDVSGNGNNTTEVAVSFGLPFGKISEGGSFNGTTSRLTKNASSMLTGNVSASMAGWVRIVANAGNFPCPINLGSTNTPGTSSAFNFYITTADEIGVGTFAVGLGNTFIGDGNFHHACATYDNTSSILKFYVDGVFIASASLTMNFLDSNIRIGYLDNNDAPDDDQAFTGDIDEVGYWQRELSALEVAELYNGGAGLTYPFGVAPSTNASILLSIL